MPLKISRRKVLELTGLGALGALFGSGTAGANGRNPLDRHLVGVEPGRADVARNAAAEVYRVLDFGDIGQVVSGWYPDEALEGLANNPNVRYIEAEGTMEAIGHTTDEDAGDPTQVQVLPWGIDRVDAEVAHHNGETGGGSSIAIIDTGIDYTHSDLGTNFAGGTDFVNGDDDPMDDHGHGTHCGGIADAVDNDFGVIGTSAAADLYGVKVLDSDGSGSYSDVAAGIEWTADQGIDVGSLSLGGGDSQTVENACEYAYGKGTLLVAAAGNDGSHPVFSTVNYPAAYPEVIAVSATDNNDDIASFSSRGPEVELAAPGVDILSSLPGDDYDRWNGTSMACPHVSGAGAQVMANGHSNTEARSILADTAEDIGLSSHEQGNGLVDVAAALGLDSSDDLGGDNSAPSVSWQNPGDGDTVSGDVSIEIQASDSDGSISSVEFFVDGSKVAEPTDDDNDGVYTYTWDSTTVSDGDHTLEAKATDDDGSTSSAAITVSTENTDDAPGVSWVNPSDGETVGGTVTIQIDADDDRDSGSDLTVEWEVGDGTWQSATFNSTSGYYEDSWDTTTVSDGDHDLDARATDTGGNTSPETRITVTVNNTNSSPTIDSYTVTEAGSPNPHAEITADWDVGDSDGDLDTVLIEVKDDTGSVVDSATHDVSGSGASGSDQFKIKHADGETFDVTLTVTDVSGSSTSETQTVTE